MLKLNEFIKKFDGTIFILGLVLIAVLVSGMTNAFAGGVTDNNNGDKGDIFVSTGENHGSNSVGTWTDPRDICGLKGDKGDTGLQGIQGVSGINGTNGKDGLQGLQGIQGIQGLSGINGKDGLNGLQGDPGIQGLQGFNGVDGTNGIDGKDGLKGDKGDKGAKGDKGDRGKTGKAGYTPIKNVDYFDGLNGTNGVNGENGKDVDPEVVNNLQKEDINLKNNINSTNSRVDDLSNRVGRLEKTQVVAELGVRVYDSKHLSITPYIQQNFTRAKVSEIGVKFLFKIGKSYEEKLIENTNQRVKAIETRLGVSPVITRVVDKKGNVISIGIEENGLSINGEF